MNYSVSGRHALVTGGAKGVGAATARRLLQAGARVSLIDLDAPVLETEAARLRSETGIGPDVLRTAVCDIADASALERTLQGLVSAAGPVEILVNNAGILVPGDYHEQPMEKWDGLMDVNVRALMRLTHLVLPGMYERDDGVIVNISSAAGTIGVAGLTAYSTSKWAVYGFSEALRNEAWVGGKSGVHIASVHPSFISQGLFAGAKIPGLGGLLVPLVKDHDVIARAVVEKAIRRRRTVIMRPRSVRLTLFLRGILPDPLFQRLSRSLGTNQSMRTWHGRDQS